MMPYFMSSVILCLLAMTFAVAVNTYESKQSLITRRRVDEAKNRAERWILNSRDEKYGWHGDTHRALMTLYLSNASLVRNSKLDTQLSVKQMELELALQLEKKCEDYGKPGSLSLGQLALFVQGILAAGNDPHNFYGKNIVRCLDQPRRGKENAFSYALTALALCNAGEKITTDHVSFLLKTLNNTSVLPDYPAMAALATVCAQKNSPAAQTLQVRQQLTRTLNVFQKSQKADGSFGNVDTSALVVQALVAAKTFTSGWNYQKAMNYLLAQQSSQGAFGGQLLSTYETLPLLSNHTFVYLGVANQIKV